MLKVRFSKTLNEIVCKKLAFGSKLPWTCSMQDIVTCIAWLVYWKLDLHKILNESKKQAVLSELPWDCLLQCIIAFQCKAWCWRLDFLKLWMRARNRQCCCQNCLEPSSVLVPGNRPSVNGIHLFCPAFCPLYLNHTQQQEKLYIFSTQTINLVQVTCSWPRVLKYRGWSMIGSIYCNKGDNYQTRAR